MRIDNIWMNPLTREITKYRISTLPFLAIFRKEKIAPGACFLLGLETNVKYISYIAILFDDVRQGTGDMEKNIEKYLLTDNQSYDFKDKYGSHYIFSFECP